MSYGLRFVECCYATVESSGAAIETLNSKFNGGCWKGIDYIIYRYHSTYHCLKSEYRDFIL